MLYYLFQILFFSLCVGITAAVYHGVLSHSPVLNWWFKIGMKYERKWFYDPIWGCVKCIAGQLCLWSYTILAFLAMQEDQGGVFSPFLYESLSDLFFSFIGLIAAICGAIFFSMLAARVITLLEK